jgi:hypothetical protein
MRNASLKRTKALRLLQLKKAFLTAYEQCGYLTEAAAVLGIPRMAHYRWLESDPDYAQQFRQLKEDVHARMLDDLERELYRRAVEGMDESVFGNLGCDAKGRSLGSGMVGRIRRYSDTLLIFKLKGERPDKYRDKAKSPVGPETQVVIKVVYEKPAGTAGSAAALGTVRPPHMTEVPVSQPSASEMPIGVNGFRKPEVA